MERHISSRQVPPEDPPYKASPELKSVMLFWFLTVYMPRISADPMDEEQILHMINEHEQEFPLMCVFLKDGKGIVTARTMHERMELILDFLWSMRTHFSRNTLYAAASYAGEGWREHPLRWEFFPSGPRPAAHAAALNL